jgi:hypothetical protein
LEEEKDQSKEWHDLWPDHEISFGGCVVRSIQIQTQQFNGAKKASTATTPPPRILVTHQLGRIS